MINNITKEHEITWLKSQLKEKDDKILSLEKTIREEKHIFNTILEGTLAGYWDWYLQEDYEYMSPTFKMMFGYEDHELENKPDAWQKIIHPDDLASVFEIFDKHVNSKGMIPYDNEVRYYHKDGSIVWVYCRGQVIEWNEAGEPIRMIGCHVDITPFKKAKQIQRFYDILKLKNKELEQFAYITSHDLQEPLRTVRSFASLLQKNYSEVLGEDGNQFLEYISGNAARMSDLIKALLDYSRLGKNASFMLIDFNEKLKNVQADLQLLIEETEAIIEYSDLPTLPAYKVELKLLFQNLIRNAIKFQKKGQKPIIRIEAVEKENFYEFSVIDNGIGIDEKHLEDIFTIFRRLHLRTEYPGTGIGLAHCKKIIELHKGQIWVESELGKGSKFCFTIPR